MEAVYTLLYVSALLTVSLSTVRGDTCPTPLNLTGTNTERILQITDPCRYDVVTRPEPHGKTQVFARIYVYFLGSIEAQNLQYTTQILLRYRWKDPRLAGATRAALEGESFLTNRIWTPHLYLVNEQDSRVMGSGRQDILVSIQPDGTVLHSTRMKVTLLCLMNLQKFPFDKQSCPLILESWSYNTSQLELSWEPDSPIKVNKQLQLTEYSLIKVYENKSQEQYSIDSDNITDSLKYYGKFAGNYSTLTVHFELERQVGHYIMDYYVPSILLVVVSWVTFWLDANAVPGRTTLGTSTMLTFITLSRNIGSSLPKVSYIKATEIWFIVCTGFIFGSLVEFAFVNIIYRRRKNVELKKVTGKYILRSTLTPQLNRRNNNNSRLGEKCKSMSNLSDSQMDSAFGSVSSKSCRCIGPISVSGVHTGQRRTGLLSIVFQRFTTQILLRYRWKDPRLQHQVYIKYEGGQILERIWSPHIYIVNEQDAKVLGSSQQDMFISFWPDGTVVQLSRMKVTLGCSMHFQKFPFDGQICPLILESWSYNASQLKLVWERSSPVTFDQGLQLPEYTLRNIVLNSSINHYDQQAGTNLAEHVDVYYGKSAKNFTTLTMYFDVQRQSGFYIMDYYMPSVLIVAVSWVSFWLDANSVPGRTILGTSTLLTFITLSRNIGQSLPKVSYIKSSEIWFIGCTVFIFGSLVEFAFVNTISRRKKNVKLQKVSGKHILQSTLTPELYHKQFEDLLNSTSLSCVSSTVDLQQQCVASLNSVKPSTASGESIDINNLQLNILQNNTAATTLQLEEGDEETSKSVLTMTPQQVANLIDLKSRICFPAAFVLFNCLYWTWTLFLL